MRHTLLLISLALVAHAHIAMWHESMFGLNWPNQATDKHQNYNSNAPITPLREFDRLTTDKWFAHGFKVYPPAPGKFLELQAGGSLVAELACNRAFTTLRNPLEEMPLSDYACQEATGPLHANVSIGGEADPSKFGGTALAIAYTSDADTVQPGDMTVISVNYTSVYMRETVYPIPADLGACPAGGCLCTWNWLHKATEGEGYGSEMYNVMFRCNVTGATTSNVLPMGQASIPVLCEDDPSTCVKGPKQPMYIYQADGNNMPMNPCPKIPPSYNMRYGFRDGAQTDLFSFGNHTASTAPTASTAASTPSSALGAAEQPSRPSHKTCKRKRRRQLP